jgi:Spy/CpxP family protein refolding chaperone
MRNRIIIIAGIAVLVIGATVLALGHGFQGAMRGHGFQGMHGPERERHGGPGPGPGMVEHMARELGLTADQQTQIKALLTAVQTTEDARHAKGDELRKQLETVTANGQFDETKVREIANAQGALMADTIVEHERLKSQVFALLTPEQRTKAEEMHKRHEGEGFRHGGPPPRPSE